MASSKNASFAGGGILVDNFSISSSRALPELDLSWPLPSGRFR